MSMIATITRVIRVRGMFSATMLMKVAAMVTPELIIWGRLWLMSWRRVSTSLV